MNSYRTIDNFAHFCEIDYLIIYLTAASTWLRLTEVQLTLI